MSFLLSNLNTWVSFLPAWLGLQDSGGRCGEALTPGSITGGAQFLTMRDLLLGVPLSVSRGSLLSVSGLQRRFVMSEYRNLSCFPASVAGMVWFSCWSINLVGHGDSECWLYLVVPGKTTLRDASYLGIAGFCLLVLW